jgi:integrase
MQKTLDPSTAKNRFQVMKAILKLAVDDQYIGRSPAIVKAPKQKDANPKFLTAEQAESLAKAMQEISGNEEFAFIIRFAVRTGMRAGEIFALQWKHIDLQRNEIRIEQNLSIGILGRPKTVNGRRTIDIGKDLTEELRQRRALPETFVFGKGDKPYAYKYDFYIKHWKKAVELTDLPSGLHFHDLRHTNASLLIAQGLPLLYVSRHLGHANISITADVYGHLYDEARKQVGSAIDQAFS